MNEATASRTRPQVSSPSAAPVANSSSSAAAGAPRTKARRGFAVMDKSRQREIASAGGRAAHARGNAHEFTPDEAREAGRKGGRSVSNDKDHMATIGRKGGIERGKRHAERLAQASDQPAQKAGSKSDAPLTKPDAAYKSDAAFIKSDAFYKTRRRPAPESAQAAS